MALTIDWPTKVITIPQSYLTHITGTLYELDTDQFRKDLGALLAAEEGIVFEDAHQHTTSYTVAGTTYARAVQMINGYSVTFEDGQYSVRLAGSNNDLFDIENGKLNQNQVQIIAQNSAGLIVGEGAAPGDIADAVCDEMLSDHTTPGSLGEAICLLYKKAKGKWKMENNVWTIYDDDGVTPILEFELYNDNGQLSMRNVVERRPI